MQWFLTSDILDLYLWGLWHNTLSCLPLTYDICATLLNHLTCLFFGFSYHFLFCYCEGNLGYMNSDYYDVRCRVFIWGSPYLDYSFDILISRIGNFSLYNWFTHSYFTYCLISCSYVLIFAIHLSCIRVPDTHATWPHLLYLLSCIWQPWTHMSRF